MLGRFSTQVKSSTNAFMYLLIQRAWGVFRKTGIRNEKKGAALALILSVLFQASSAYADKKLSFDIAPQNASEALPVFGQQADISVVYRFDEVKNFKTNKLQGIYSLKDAVALLLKDSGLTASFKDRHHLIIKIASYQERTPMKPNTPKTRKRGLAAAIGALVSAFTYQAVGQDDGANDVFGLEEIIVTAQRREQNLQEVPFAVSAFGEDLIAKSDIDEITSLSTLVPGLLVSGDEKMNLTLRGVGVEIATSLAEAAIPINIDGVYMSRTSVGSSVYADLQNIEVLRGPQGTLYGRNATGGTVNLWTKVPDGELEGNIGLLVGNGGRERVRGALGFPIAGDTLSARVAFASDQIDGYRKNLTTGNDVEGRDHLSYRGVVRWEPADTFNLTLRASQSDNDNSTPVPVWGFTLNPNFNPFVIANGQGADDPQNVRLDRESRLETEDDLYSATAEWELGSVVLKSVSALQEHSVDRIQDSEGTDVDWTWTNFKDSSEAFTQEFTLTSNDDGPVEWVAGVWYYDDDLDATMDFFLNPAYFQAPAGPAGLTPLQGFGLVMNQQTTAWAGFGQATWSLNERLRLTGGLRYSSEEKEFRQTREFRFVPFTAPVCQDFEYKEDWSNVAPKASVDFDLNDDVLLYTSYSRGFKAGGGNMSECNDQFDEENLTAYEVGFKSELFNNQLRLNANAFYYDYTDYQANRVIINTAAIENADGAEIYGLELDLFASPVENFTVSSGLSIMESEFRDFETTNSSGELVNLKGNELRNAPGATFNIALEYELEVGGNSFMTFRGEHTWIDDHYLEQFNEEWALQEAYGKTNLRVIYALEGGSLSGLEVHAFVNNLEDEDVLRRASPIGLLGGVVYNYHEPRTYGVEVKYSF